MSVSLRRIRIWVYFASFALAFPLYYRPKIQNHQDDAVWMPAASTHYPKLYMLFSTVGVERTYYINHITSASCQSYPLLCSGQYQYFSITIMIASKVIMVCNLRLTSSLAKIMRCKEHVGTALELMPPFVGFPCSVRAPSRIGTEYTTLRKYNTIK